MKKASIGIVIVHFGEFSQTLSCLNSLKAISWPAEIHLSVAVVNNTSDKQISRKLKNHSVVKKVITNTQNIGFAKAVNQGIRYHLTQAVDFVCLLNNDVLIEDDFLSPIIHEFKKNNQVGILAPVIQHHSNSKTQYDLGGTIYPHIFWPKHTNVSHLPKQKTIIECDFVSGCCMVIPIEVIKQIGLLREDFFLYFEDVDWCLRAKKHGYVSAVAVQSQVYHKQSQSVRKDVQLQHSQENIASLVREQLPGIRKYPALLFHWLLYRYIRLTQ
jgi:GT2 family glycosyltransferase